MLSIRALTDKRWTLVPRVRLRRAPARASESLFRAAGSGSTMRGQRRRLETEPAPHWRTVLKIGAMIAAREPCVALKPLA